MKIIDNIIAKRKLSDGRNVYCDKSTTGIIIEKSFKVRDNEVIVGPLSVTLEGDLYILEGSTDPSNGLMYLFLISYNGATGEIEDAVLVKDSNNPKYHLTPSAFPVEIIDSIKKNVRNFVIGMITSPVASPIKESMTTNDFFPDLNAQPTTGTNPQWNGRINI